MRIYRVTLRRMLIAIGVAISLVGCGPDSPDSAGLSGSAGAAGPSTGIVSLAITDAPVDSALKVCVEFNSVEFKHADDGVDNVIFNFDTPRSINLLALQNGVSELLLDGVELPAGQYNWVRLGVSSARGLAPAADEVTDSEAVGDCLKGEFDASGSYIVSGTYIVPGIQLVNNMYVPSGDQSGLKMNRGFVLPAGGSADFTIDFDLRKSVKMPSGQFPDYKLRPTLRMEDNALVGALQGTVDPALIMPEPDPNDPASCDPFVYVFAGSVSGPDDMDDIAPEPIATGRVVLNDKLPQEWTYRIGLLAENMASGSYKAYFTCGPDDPDTDDADTVFEEPTDGAGFSVTAGSVTIRDFAPPPAI